MAYSDPQVSTGNTLAVAQPFNEEQYIRQAAAARGIDPDIAVRVANSEGGLKNPAQQSLVRKNGVQEPSYGPFQLLVGGGDTGFPQGLGNDFVSKTGLDPSDPANVKAGIDFALDNAAQKGWGQWYGAAKAGVGMRDGIGASGTSVAAAPSNALALPGRPGQPQTMGGQTASAGGLTAQMKKAMALTWLQSSLNNVKLQRVDYDPFAVEKAGNS